MTKQIAALTDKDFNKLMDYLVTHAVIGVAAKWGMIICIPLIVLSYFSVISFNPLVGFILVPLACIWVALGAMLSKPVKEEDSQ